MNFTINNATMRMVYMESLKIARAAGLNPQSTKNTMSDLVLEQALSATITNYNFPVTNVQSNAAQFNTEIRLNLQDSFVASSWGVFLLAPSSGTDATFRALTYGSTAAFTTTPAAAAAAEVLYNSYARVTVNNDVLVPVWHLSRHRLVPQSQQVAAAANQNGIAEDQIDLSTEGFYPVEPYLVFIGSKNIQVQVILPAAIATVQANSRVRIHYRGLLMQNSTTVS
jgi:hypothetical protein